MLDAAPPRARWDEPAKVPCTTSNVVPALTGIWIPIGIVAAIYGLGRINAGETEKGRGPFILGLGLVIGGGIGMERGFSLTRECRAYVAHKPVAAPIPSPVSTGQVPPPSPDANDVDEPVGPGCEKDTDCKGDRICDAGQCIEPINPTPE